MIQSILLILLSINLVYGSSQTTSNTPTRTGSFPSKQMAMQKHEIVKLVAKEISETLPQIIDKYTALTNVVGQGDTLVYTFEIHTGIKSDEAIQKQDRSRMKKAVTVGVCQSSRKFLESGINTSYVYKSAKTKVELFRFDISQKDCTGLVK